MNPDQNDPNSNPPNPEDNKYIPPEPGQFVHQASEQFDKSPGVEPSTGPLPSEKLEVDQQITKKKKQAMRLIVATGVFGVLAVIGIIIILASFGSDGQDLSDDNLPIDEQLMNDANTFGLGVINFRNGDEHFEITPDKVANFKVSYIPLDFSDPRNDQAYELTTAIPEVGQLQYVLGGVCNDDDSVSQSGESGQFAVRVLLETGSLYCVEKSEVVQVTEAPKP